MARQLRLEYPGALYHVTVRGNEQHTIFHNEIDRQHFLTVLGHEIIQQGWRCYAYCLMGNHYHLFLETPEPNLSRGMWRLNWSNTQRFNWRHRRVGHLRESDGGAHASGSLSHGCWPGARSMCDYGVGSV